MSFIIVLVALVAVLDGQYISITLPLPFTTTQDLSGTYVVTPDTGHSSGLDAEVGNNRIPGNSNTYLNCRDGPNDATATDSSNSDYYGFSIDTVGATTTYLLRRFSVQAVLEGSSVNPGFTLQYNDPGFTGISQVVTNVDTPYSFPITSTATTSPHIVRFGVFTGSNNFDWVGFRLFTFDFDPHCVPSDPHGTFSPATVPASNSATLTCAQRYYNPGTATVTCTGDGTGTSTLSVVGTCTGCSANCNTCSSAACSACDPGFYLNPSQACAACTIEKCSECSSDTVCTQCSAGFYLTGAGTVCTECTQSVCASGQWMDLVKCGITPSATSTGCTACSLANCVECSSATVCTQCAANTHYLNGGNTCTACSTLTGCVQCSSGTVCTQCTANTYYLNGGTCIACSTVSSGCTQCSSASVCTRCTPSSSFLTPTNLCAACGAASCSSGYYSGNGNCGQAPTFLDNGCRACVAVNCERCTGSGASTCTQCNAGFFTTNAAGGTCSACGTDCSSSQWMDAAVCGVTTPTSNGCTSCGTVSTGCIRCAAAGDGSPCSRCTAGASWLNGAVCTACGLASCSGAQYYSGNGNCGQASAVSDNGCRNCVPTNCASCSGSGATACTQCNAGYYVTGGTCTACVEGSCATNQWMDTAVCGITTASTSGCTACSASLTANCLACDSVSACLQCTALTHYLTAANQCAACSAAISQCTQCSSGTVCTRCVPTSFYVTPTNQCAACGLASCSPGQYYLGNSQCGLAASASDNGCRNCVSNCATCPGATTCTQCNPGFYVNTARTCSACTGVCNPGWTYDNTKCGTTNATFDGCVTNCRTSTLPPGPNVVPSAACGTSTAPGMTCTLTCAPGYSSMATGGDQVWTCSAAGNAWQAGSVVTVCQGLSCNMRVGSPNRPTDADYMQFGTCLTDVQHLTYCTVGCADKYYLRDGGTDLVNNTETFQCSASAFVPAPTAFNCNQCPPECAKCVNSARCLTCAYGYEYDSVGSLGCKDMDSCAINNGGCGLDAVCTDAPGGRTCGCGSSGCAIACDVVSHGSSLYFQSTFVTGIPIQGFGDIPQVPPPCSLDNCYAYNVHTTAPSAVADVNRFTIDVWVMFAPVGLDYTTSFANGGPLVGAQPDVGTNNNYFVLSVTAAGFVQYDFRLGGSASSVLCDDRATLFDGKWHHVLLSHYVDTGASLPTRITIRVDGTSSPKGSADRSAGTFFSWPATSGGLYLGSHKPVGSSWQLFRGHMSHLRIWLGAIPRTTAVDAYVSKLSYDLCNRYLSEYTNVGDASQPFYLLLSLPMYDFSVLDGSADRTRLSLAPSPGYYVFGPANSNPSAVQLTTLPLGVTYRRIESAGTDVCKSAALACAARGMRVCTEDEYLGISSPPALIVGGGTGTRSTWRHTLHQSSPAFTGTDDDYCQGTELGRGYRCCMPYLTNSVWGSWEDCTVPCGGGTRKRTCSPGTRGLACEGSSQMACNTVPCQADRQVPRFSDPDIPCSQDCGSHGIQARTCNRVQLDDWFNCTNDAFVNCSRTPCIPAEYFYGEYSECSANCTRSDPPAGYHAPHRTRICYMIQDDGVHGPVKTALADAAECRQRSYGDDTVLCNRHFCPIHGGWSDWSNCSATCNGGNRTRTCTAPPPAYSGRYCEGQSREACGLDSCVVLGIWSEWSNCSVNCGPGGTRFRFCSAVYPEPPAACVGLSVEPCSAPDCTVQGEWGPWKPCNQTCGSGGRRFRECNNPVPVPFPTTATDPLWCKGWPAGRMGACENGTETACREPGGWSSWSNCTKPCGGGFRNRNCTNPKPKMGHPTCIGHVEEPCNLRPCPVSGSWSDWSDCNVPCGNGTRIRFCNNPPTQFGGAFCPGSNSTACSKPDCSVPLGFGPWGPCSKECGGGIQTRGCLPPGAGCPEKGLTVQACNNESCSSFGEWSKWTACSRDCGGGVQTRNCTSTNRTCLGVTSQRCNEFSCDADGEWTPWSDCSVDFCGGGVQTRKCLGRLGLGRLCNLTDGTPDKDIETKSCFDDPCPADICTIPGVCQNNATCIDVQNYGPGWRFLCDCTPFTFGKHCEFRIVPCDTHPCDNGGTCTNVNGTVNGTVVGVAYNCTCPPGYEGSSCHTVARQTRIPGPVGESTPPPPTKEEQIAAKAETVEERVARLEREGLNVKWYTGALDEGLGETDKHNLNRIVVAWREGQEDGQQRLVPHAKDTAEAISRQAKLLNPDLTPQLPYDSSLPNPSNQPG